MPETLKRIAVDFERAEAEEKFDLWADAVRPLFYVSPLGSKESPPATLARFWLVDGLVFCEGSFGKQFIHRSKRHIVDRNPNFLTVQYYRAGTTWGEIQGHSTTRTVGEVNVTDHSQEHCALCAPTSVRSVIVGHQLVQYDPGVHPATMRFGTETVVGHVLQQALSAVFERLDDLTEPEAPVLATGLIGLIRQLIHTAPDIAQTTTEFAAARSLAIRKYIDRHVGTGNLTIEDIRTTFCVSRATLYREFRREGGVDRYLLARRLDVALRSLSNGSHARGVVTKTAERLGFSSTTHFSREFRRQFGVSPRDVIGVKVDCMDGEHRDPIAKIASTGDRLDSFMSRI
ncbi:MAG: helix-turn-helix transcriptional regulator [Pseudomonadota bacterium]